VIVQYEAFVMMLKRLLDLVAHSGPGYAKILQLTGPKQQQGDREDGDKNDTI